MSFDSPSHSGLPRPPTADPDGAAHRRHLEGLVRDAPACVANLSGPALVVTVANQLFRQLFGGRTLAGLPLRVALPELPDQAFFALLDQVYATGAICYSPGEVLFHDPARTDRSVPVHFTFIAQAVREAADGPVKGLLLFAYDVSAHVRQRAQPAAPSPSPAGTAEQLGAANAELATANAELSALNEEFSVTNAELDATNDELSRTNEQLARANAALTTANADIRAQAHELRLSHKALGRLHRQLEARGVTERASAQHRIQEQAAQLNRVLESIADAFLATDREGKLTYLNREGERLLNVQREQALGNNLWAMLPGAAGGVYHRKCQQALETGEPVHFEAHAQGANRWFEVKAYPFAEGLSVFFSDITQRVASEQQLKLLALVAQGTVNGVIITDAAGRVEWVNAGFTRDTGYTLAEVRGKKPGEVLQGPGTDAAAVRRFRERLPLPEPFSVTLLNYTKAGQPIWLECDVTPIFNEAGELTQYIALEQNITRRREVEAQQAQMTQELYRHNRDLQQFAYIISHNLRAPLSNVLGLATLLAKVDRHSPVFDTSLAHLRQGADQADAVLKDLKLVLSIRDKQDLQAPEAVPLQEVCEEALNNLDESLQQAGGRVQLHVEAGLAVRGTRAYVYSIFYNLLSNAIKYRADQRPLLVEITCFYNEKGGISISFTDNGSGFDLVKAGSYVFQLYKRFHTNQQGRGIGLFLVKTHVEALGGTIQVASEVNVGTRFLLEFDAGNPSQ